MITLPLLFVLSTFLTAISLSNFYSLNSCLAAIFLSINISVVPLSKSTLTVTPLCISNFSTLIFNYTSPSILKVRLTFLCLPLSFATPFNSPGCALLYYTFFSIGYTTFLFSPFEYPHYLCLFEIISCPLFSSIWHSFCLHLSHSIYITITSLVYYPNSNRHALSSMPSPTMLLCLLS